MAFADEQSYEEMIQALQNFKQQTQEQCQIMTNAGRDCVENTDNDPAAEKSSAKLATCVSKIEEALETVDSVIAALQEELEAIREAARKADQIDE